MTAKPLKELAYKQDGKYRFELVSDYQVQIDALANRTTLIRDFGTASKNADGATVWQSWARLSVDGRLAIRTGYAWDGCSPAWQFAGRWWGTPTPEATRAACLVHDVLYQFLDDGFWTRAEADAVFLALMKQAGFPLASIYYRAVRIFGGIHHALFR